jgi:squalene-hopene/tetraprenyl-beta-curcumene cyclase
MDSSAAPELVPPSGTEPEVLLPAAGRTRLDRSVASAGDWLLARQDPAGWWRGELEGDTTLESYLVLIEAFFGRRANAKTLDLARVIRAEALPEGGWSQYPGGPAELSVSCLSYFALKVAGDGAEAPHMRRAAEAIRGLGGAEAANSYTKYHLAFFGQYPWSAVPAIPPEMIFSPRAAPFTVYDMSSWSRTIFVPLSILYAHKPRCELPAACGVEELFTGDRARPPRGGWRRFFTGVDRTLKLYERLPGAEALRRAAVRRAEAWMIERLEDSDGLSAILPAMANSVLAMKCLGYDEQHPLLKENLAHLDGLSLRDETGALRVQPCLSPVWDTVLAAHALVQAGLGEHPALRRAATWLLSKQCRRPGDWVRNNPAPPGGWYFEQRNEFYPDVDDTCMALMVLKRVRAEVPAALQQAAIERGLAWMLGMQNSDGGWASFDRGNDKQWLTQIPFADHNAMIDPSTADITSRVLECLSLFSGFTLWHPVVDRARRFLYDTQLPEGCWYGRWGVNYLYGTWQVLCGLRAIGEDMEGRHVRRAVGWLLAHQNGDGGWGESIASYDEPARQGQGPSTPSQTAWALMGLLAASEVDHQAVRQGVRYLLERQDGAGTWAQEPWTGTGFPRVFYLNYHHYRHYFPLRALAQYRAARFGSELAPHPE